MQKFIWIAQMQNLAPKKLAPNLLFLNSHEAVLFGLIKPQVLLIEVILLMGEAFMPIYIAIWTSVLRTLKLKDWHIFE